MLIAGVDVDETDAAKVADAIGDGSPSLIGVIAIVLTNQGHLSVGYNAIDGVGPFEELGRAIADHLDSAHPASSAGTGVLRPVS